jgi:histidine triad (HIT) family protein
MNPSIFTRIINGEIPCHKVYEDDKTFAFMDIEPIQPGMVLVIPKEEIDDFENLSDELISAVMTTSKKIMIALKKVFPDKIKIGIQVEGLEVPHAHVKLIPISSGEEFHTQPIKEVNHEELAALAEKIRSNL